MGWKGANEKSKKTEELLEIERLEKFFEDKSDRNLAEEQVKLNRIRNKYLKSIKNNVQFFFWITLLGMIAWLIFSVTMA